MMFLLFLTLPCSIMAASIFYDDYSETCVEGQQAPDMDYKQQYYECIEESWEPMTCPDGLVFDPINGNCFEVPDHCLDEDEYEDEETVDNNHEQYYECIREYWESMDIPDRLANDDVHGGCYTEKEI